MQQGCLPHHVLNSTQANVSGAALHWQEGEPLLKRCSLLPAGRGGSDPAHDLTIWGLSASKGVSVAYLCWYLFCLWLLQLAASAHCLADLCAEKRSRRLNGGSARRGLAERRRCASGRGWLPRLHARWVGYWAAAAGRAAAVILWAHVAQSTAEYL